VDQKQLEAWRTNSGYFWRFAGNVIRKNGSVYPSNGLRCMWSGRLYFSRSLEVLKNDFKKCESIDLEHVERIFLREVASDGIRAGEVKFNNGRLLDRLYLFTGECTWADFPSSGYEYPDTPMLQGGCSDPDICEIVILSTPKTAVPNASVGSRVTAEVGETTGPSSASQQRYASPLAESDSLQDLTVEAQLSHHAGFGSHRVQMTFSNNGIYWKHLEQYSGEFNLPWSDIESYECYASPSYGHKLEILDGVDGNRGGGFSFRRIDLRAINRFLEKYALAKAKRACNFD
jgi:hypothetical protein